MGRVGEKNIGDATALKQLIFVAHSNSMEKFTLVSATQDLSVSASFDSVLDLARPRLSVFIVIRH